MKQIDYIIVGCGLAGIAFCEVLRSYKKSYVVFDNGSQQSSTVAAGMYNPVILKRFTPVWKATEQLRMAIPMYLNIEKRLGISLDYQFELWRRFASVEEQNMWFTAADKPKLSPYLNLNLTYNNNDRIDAPHGYGVVNNAGRVDTALLLKTYREYLLDRGELILQSFRYEELFEHQDGIAYANIKARHIIFAEGYGVKQNPYFKNVPINGTKGEVLTVRIKNLKLDNPIKSSVFIIPIGEDLYKVGATYSHTDKSNRPTEDGKNELLEKVQSFIKAPIELIDHKAGVRPTVKDRRPLVGRHITKPNLYLLNGLGSRGVMIAPYVAQQLFAHIENNNPLDSDIDLRRFN